MEMVIKYLQNEKETIPELKIYTFYEDTCEMAYDLKISSNFDKEYDAYPRYCVYLEITRYDIFNEKTCEYEEQKIERYFLEYECPSKSDYFEYLNNKIDYILCNGTFFFQHTEEDEEVDKK